MDFPVLSDSIDGVVDDIEKDLLELRGITGDLREIGLRIDLNIDIAVT